MPKYLVEANYTAEGTKGLLRDGGSKRRAVVEAMMKELGGSVDAFYYAFGDRDLVGIFTAPDNASIAALSLVVSASGAVNIRTTPLLTPEEIDQAAQRTVGYRPPGS